MIEPSLSADYLGKDVLKEIVKFATPNDRGRLIQVNREFREAIKELVPERKISRRGIMVSAGLTTTFILTQYRGKPRLYGCGCNENGQLGLGHKNNQSSLQRLEIPKEICSLEGVVAGNSHTLVFGCDSLGKPLLFACGYNEYGQLGLGDNYNQNSLQPVRLPEALNSQDGVVAGSNHTLVFGRDSLGKPLLFACGLNFYGQLGLGDKNDRSSLQRLELPQDLNSLESVVAGFNHTLVFGRDSKGKPALFACGENDYGQLGLGHQNNQSSLQRLELPEALNSLEGVVAGSNHTLVFGRDSLGKPLLFACGLNFYGQLGLGDKNDRISLQPVTLPECLNSLEGIAAGGLHTLVFGRDSNKKPLLFACGWNNFGQLGLGDKNDRSSLHRIELPEALNSLEGVVASFNDTFVFGFDSFGEPALFACGVEHLLTTVPKPVICDSEKYRLKVAIENHVQTLTNEFSWFGLKKSPQEKIKMLKQLCENLEQVDNRNSKQKLSDTMSTFLNEHKQTIKEHRNPFRNWGFFRPESPTRSETFLTEKMNSLNS